MFPFVVRDTLSFRLSVFVPSVPGMVFFFRILLIGKPKTFGIHTLCYVYKRSFFIHGNERTTGLNTLLPKGIQKKSGSYIMIFIISSFKESFLGLNYRSCFGRGFSLLHV